MSPGHAWMPTPFGWLGLVVVAAIGAMVLARLVFALRRPPAPRTLDLTEVVQPAPVHFDERQSD